jgi:ABC-type multidrug transport system ATPase subunit
LNDLGLSHLRKQKAFSLSGGERRRVEIARALVLSPSFILLDEPFAGIDPLAVLDIQNIVCQLKSKGIGIIITDHNVRETLGVCDRAYILNEGSVLEEPLKDCPESKRGKFIWERSSGAPDGGKERMGSCPGTVEAHGNRINRHPNLCNN